MRVHFEQQLSLGSLPISEVEIDLKSRHELPPVLAALQHIFVTNELNKQVFAVLEQRICSGKKETGRYGMSLWEIFVLACVRLNLDIDFDFLLDLANQHNDLRGILGVQKTDFTAGKKYAYQTIVDNVTQLDEQTLKTINEIIVKEGHTIIKKKRRSSRRKKF